ncbi:prepilin peptidase [candidate division KSB1 bacterium]
MFFQVSILFYILLVLSWIDVDMGVVPSGIIIFGIIIGFSLLILKNGFYILPNIYGAGVGFLLVVISGLLGKLLFKKEAIGGGDLYLTTMLGLYLGWKYIITAYFLSFLIAGFYSLYLIIKLKKLPIGHEIKLVPFLSLGGILGLTIGDKINNFYLENFIM